MKIKLIHEEVIELTKEEEYAFLLAKANGKPLEYLFSSDFNNIGDLELVEWREML